jgi:sn-2 palmitoyl-lipid 9-desaturase
MYWSLVRVGLCHQATWLVNSACHLWGYRNFETAGSSRNNWIVATLTLGEGWHNNHHADPSRTRHGLKLWEVDPTFGLARLLEMAGLARISGNSARGDSVVSTELRGRRGISLP